MQSGRRETEKERESEPQRTEEGSTEKQTKGVGKGKKAHSDTRSGRRPRQSSRDVQGGGSTSTSPRHPQPAPGSGPLDMFLHRTPEACKAVAWAVSPRLASQEAQTLPRVTVVPVLQAELKPPSCLVQAPSPRRSISGFSVPPHRTYLSAAHIVGAQRVFLKWMKTGILSATEVPSAVIPLIATRWQPHRRNEKSAPHWRKNSRQEPRGLPGRGPQEGIRSGQGNMGLQSDTTFLPRSGIRTSILPFPPDRIPFTRFADPPCAPVSKSCPTSPSSWRPGWDFQLHLSRLPHFHSPRLTPGALPPWTLPSQALSQDSTELTAPSSRGCSSVAPGCPSCLRPTNTY